MWVRASLRRRSLRAARVIAAGREVADSLERIAARMRAKHSAASVGDIGTEAGAAALWDAAAEKAGRARRRRHLGQRT